MNKREVKRIAKQLTFGESVTLELEDGFGIRFEKINTNKEHIFINTNVYNCYGELVFSSAIYEEFIDEYLDTIQELIDEHQ